MTRVTIKRRLREPDEVASRKHSIRNHCLACCGFQNVEVRMCEAEDCWLWPWRMGTTPDLWKRGREHAVEVDNRPVLDEVGVDLPPGTLEGE